MAAHRVAARFALVATLLTACAPGPDETVDLPAPPERFDTAGEVVETYARPGASVRDAEGRDTQRVTIWYPAADGSTATARLIGPADRPYFISGEAADGADFAPDAGRLPLIVVSHGFGGSARQLAWLGAALAREGYIVIAVDHPGNNGTDPRTPQGALLYWERADDLRFALDAVLTDPDWGSRIDPDHVGAIGYSMGGGSVLIELGAEPDLTRLNAYCQVRPADSLCARTIVDGDFGTVDREAVLAELGGIVGSGAITFGEPADGRIDSALLIAPALGPVFSPGSLEAIDRSVLILQGDRDTVTPSAINAEMFAAHLPNDRLESMPGVGHIDFIGLCAPAGEARYPPLCVGQVPRPDTHRRAIEAAVAFFDTTLRP